MRRILMLIICLVPFVASAALTDAIKLKVQGTSGTDETVIRFMPGCSDSYNNGYDAHKLFSSSPVPALYTKDSTGGALSINAQSPYSADRHINLFLSIPSAGSYTLSSNVLGSFQPGVVIIIEDLKTGIKTNITSQAYSFQVASGSVYTTQTPSFVIHFLIPAKIIFVKKSECGAGNGIFAFSKAEAAGKTFTVIDSATSQVVKNGAVGNVTDSVLGVAGGHYILEVSYDAATSVRSNVIITEDSAPVAGFLVDHNIHTVGTPVTFSVTSESYSSLEWNFEDASTASDSVVDHVFSQPGTYNVTLKVFSGQCSDETSQSVVINSVTSAKETIASSRSITINDRKIFYNSSSSTVQIVDISGKLIYKNFNYDNNINLHVPSSTYLLSLGDEVVKINLQ
jgi:PKD repeat protein